LLPDAFLQTKDTTLPNADFLNTQVQSVSRKKWNSLRQQGSFGTKMNAQRQLRESERLSKLEDRKMVKKQEQQLLEKKRELLDERLRRWELLNPFDVPPIELFVDCDDNTCTLKKDAIIYPTKCTTVKTSDVNCSTIKTAVGFTTETALINTDLDLILDELREDTEIGMFFTFYLSLCKEYFLIFQIQLNSF
jgi:hypothetical protein